MFLASEQVKPSERPTRPSGPESESGEWHDNEKDRITKPVITQKIEHQRISEYPKASSEQTDEEETRPTQPMYLQQTMRLRMRHQAANTFYHYQYKKGDSVR